jgi:hypothetical protein
MASDVTNSFDAERLHHPTVIAVKIIPMAPLEIKQNLLDDIHPNLLH